MNTTPRKMPSELAIRAHWAKRLWAIKGYDSEAEFLERGTCFACGMDGKEKAHIVARVVGGDDSPENLHILCSVCHKDSEYLDGDRYMAWLVERSPVDMFMSSAMRCGFNPAAMMQLNRRVERCAASDSDARLSGWNSRREVMELKETGWPLIELGYGLVEVAEGTQGEKHALIFGRNGTGEIGEPTQPDRVATHEETLAVVTFANVASLDVVVGKLQQLRAKMLPDNATLPGGEAIRAE